MRDHQLGGRDGLDTRFPDWHVILKGLAEEGECVVQFKMENIIDGDMLQQVRLAALYTLSPPHVVAVVRGEAGSVRVYDKQFHRKIRSYIHDVTSQTVSTAAWHNDSDSQNGTRERAKDRMLGLRIQ